MFSEPPSGDAKEESSVSWRFLYGNELVTMNWLQASVVMPSALHVSVGGIVCEYL